MAVCIVTYRDSRGSEHHVEVPAESLYEAAVRGLAALRACRWIADQPSSASMLRVTVKPPVVVHDVQVGDVLARINEPPKSPAEATKRRLLRELLGYHSDV